MTTYVVDASVAAKWFFSEEYSDAAHALREGDDTLIAPRFLQIELVNVARSKVRRGQFSRASADELPKHLDALPVAFTDDAALLLDALQLAFEHDRSVYDALCLALALQQDCALVTADRRFVQGMAGNFEGHIRWVADLDDAGEGAPA